MELLKIQIWRFAFVCFIRWSQWLDRFWQERLCMLLIIISSFGFPKHSCSKLSNESFNCFAEWCSDMHILLMSASKPSNRTNLRFNALYSGANIGIYIYPWASRDFSFLEVSLFLNPLKTSLQDSGSCFDNLRKSWWCSCFVVSFVIDF